MNLHDIPKEALHYGIPEDWIKAAGNFQHEFNNHHPIVFVIENGKPVSMGYRNGNFELRLQENGFDSYGIRSWARRRNTYDLNWDLVEIIYR